MDSSLSSSISLDPYRQKILVYNLRDEQDKKRNSWQFHNQHFNQINQDIQKSPQLQRILGQLNLSINDLDHESEDIDGIISQSEESIVSNQKYTPSRLEDLKEQIFDQIKFDLDVMIPMELEEYMAINLVEYEVWYQDSILSEQQPIRQLAVDYKNNLELLKDYNDSFPLFRLRKVVMQAQGIIQIFCYSIIKSSIFDYIILCIILLNIVTLIISDPTSEYSDPIYESLDLFMLIAYTIEMTMKILGLGFILDRGAYLRDGWNILDFLIVTMSIIPYLMNGQNVNISVLRSLRILRPLRTISSVKELKVLLGAIFSALPYLANTIIILIFFFLIFAIMGLQIFQGTLKHRCFHQESGVEFFKIPLQLCGGAYQCQSDYICGKGLSNPNYGITNFDTIFYSLLMVFQTITLEGWTEIEFWLFDSFSQLTVIYFILLVFVGAFFLLNLTLAVIKAKFTDQDDPTKEKPKVENEVSSEDEEYIPPIVVLQKFRGNLRKQQQGWSHGLEIIPNYDQLDTNQNVDIGDLLQKQNEARKRVRHQTQIQLDKAKKPQHSSSNNDDLQMMHEIYGSGKQISSKQVISVPNVSLARNNQRVSIFGINDGKSQEDLKQLFDEVDFQMRNSIQKKVTKELSKDLNKEFFGQDKSIQFFSDQRASDDENFQNKNYFGNSSWKNESPLKPPLVKYQKQKSPDIASQIQIRRASAAVCIDIPLKKTLSKYKTQNFHFDNAAGRNRQNCDATEQKISSVIDKGLKLNSIREFKLDRIFAKKSELDKKFTDLEYASESSDKLVTNVVEQQLLREQVIMKMTKATLIQKDELSKLENINLNRFKFTVQYPLYEQFISENDVRERSRVVEQQLVIKNVEQLMKLKVYEYIHFTRKESQAERLFKNQKYLLRKSGNSFLQNYFISNQRIQFSFVYPHQGNLVSLIPDVRIPLKRSFRIRKFYKEQNQQNSLQESRASSPKKKFKQSLHNINTYENWVLIFNQAEEIPQINDVIDNIQVYWILKQQEYGTSIKNSLIWSGDEVLIQPYSSHRCNFVFLSLSTCNQESTIYIAGFKGVILVVLRKIELLMRSKFVEHSLTFIVICNTTVLALDGSITDSQNTLLVLNNVFSYIFILEFLLKIISFRVMGYVRDRMNLFDGCIVIISIIELTLISGSSHVGAFRSLRILRTFRVLRVTRLLRAMAFMKVIIGVIGRTLQSFIYIALLLLLFILIYSLLGMQLYGGEITKLTDNDRVSYDNFQKSFICTFQLLTLENWNNLIKAAFRTSVNKFVTTIYMVSWIFIGNWVFLNLFLAILLDGFTSKDVEKDLNDETTEEIENRFLEDLEEKMFTEPTVTQAEGNQLKLAQVLQENMRQIGRQAFVPRYLDIQASDNQGMQSSTSAYRPTQSQISSVKNMKLNCYESVDLREYEDQQKMKRALFKDVECEFSLYCISKNNIIRIKLYKLVTDKRFDSVILGFIVISSLKLAIDTYLPNDSDAFLVSQGLDELFTIIFSLESMAKIVAFGFWGERGSYLTETWSQLDFFIVTTSLIDASFNAVDLPALKVLRLLRTLRPLRFISHNINMRVVVNALLESVVAILNVLVVVLLIWVMFVILGMNLLQGRMGLCNIVDYYGVSRAKCEEIGSVWIYRPYNFENFWMGLKFLFALSSLEGWPEFLYWCIDSNTEEYGPEIDNYQIVTSYIILFILVGSLFLMNLFVGVIFYHFTMAQKNESSGSHFLTEEQQNWIEIQRMIVVAKNVYVLTDKPNQYIRAAIFNLVHKWQFEAFIMVVIVLNVISMTMSYEGQSSYYSYCLEQFNPVFTSIFIVETILKLIALGLDGYWSNSWNQFDLFVVISSVIDIILNFLKSSGGNSSFLRLGPQLIRILRVTRLLKLVKAMRSLQKLIETLIYTLPSLMNVLALLSLVFFIFAVLGVFVLKDTPPGLIVDDEYNNFKNFGNALLILFRCSTGEDWPKIMYDCTIQTQWAQLYFISFIMIVNFIMLNLFILITIQYFEDFHLKEDNPLDQFKDSQEVFLKLWPKYTHNHIGEKIDQKYLVDFFYELPEPLGYGQKETKQFIAKEIMTLKLNGDGLGHLMFNEVLFAAMKRAHARINCDNPSLLQYLQNVEAATRLQIEQQSDRIHDYQAHKVQRQKTNIIINPLVQYLFNHMCFKSWLNYSLNDLNNSDDGLNVVDEQFSLEDVGAPSQDSFMKKNDNFMQFDEIKEEDIAEDEEYEQVHKKWSRGDNKLSDQYEVEQEKFDSSPVQFGNIPPPPILLLIDQKSLDNKEFDIMTVVNFPKKITQLRMDLEKKITIGGSESKSSKQSMRSNSVM